MSRSKSVHISLPAGLLQAIDRIVACTGASRSTFVREALERAVWEHWVRQGEQQDADAFARQPQAAADIDAGEDAEAWGC
jgi:metal-responsive CopG/Arc/MetJ family transcriptional regulator